MSTNTTIRTQKDLQDQLTNIVMKHEEAYNAALKAIENTDENLKPDIIDVCTPSCRFLENGTTPGPGRPPRWCRPLSPGSSVPTNLDASGYGRWLSRNRQDRAECRARRGS